MLTNTRSSPIVADPAIPLRKVPDAIHEMIGVRPSMGAVYRWVASGVSGNALEVFKVGGRVYARRSAIEQFLNATNGADANAA